MARTRETITNSQRYPLDGCTVTRPAARRRTTILVVPGTTRPLTARITACTPPAIHRQRPRRRPAALGWRR